MSRRLLVPMLFAVAFQVGCSKPSEVQCMPGWSLCAAACADLQSDSENCGSCGNACAGDQSCVSGVCSADCTKQLHAPMADPWGLTWDGLERPKTSHSAARSACEAIGGRLPTLSELHRVSAVKTGAVGDTYKTSVLWSLTPSDKDMHMTIKLSDGGTSSLTDATTNNYRCVCAPPSPDAFAGGACQGAPGKECFSFSGNATLDYDSWDRPLATKAAAIWDCAFSGAHLATPERLAAAILASLPPDSTVPLHTGDQESDVNGTSVKWSNESFTANVNVFYLSPTTLSPFRCMGARNTGTVSASSLMGGFFAQATGVVADGANHGTGETVAFATAVDRCFDAGGHLPTTSELASVAMQGLSGPGATTPLWTGDETCSNNAATYSWAGIAAWPGVSGWTVTALGFSSSAGTSHSAKASLLPYRCIYYPVDASYAGPADCNGGCKRYDLTNGRGSGPAATIWLDSTDRDLALYGDAVYTCAGLGGRLASARDLVEGIKNGLPGVAGGSNVLTSDIGCGSATVYAIPQWSGSSNDAYQDTAGVNLSKTTSAKFRCMWTNEIR